MRQRCDISNIRGVMAGLILLMLVTVANASPQQDSYGLYHFFDKLRANEQVTVVAIGGSITQAGNGWSRKTAQLIGDAFPDARVKFVNAGISGTGSKLGVFRLQRDVIAHHPDLVFVEFAVNDGGAPDEACIRNLESIVVRLRDLPDPPAMVFVETAAQAGGNHKRHDRVAAHHHLISVDMQAAVEEHMQKTGAKWADLFSDNVHPNDAGHVIYANTLWQHLLPYVTKPQNVSPPEKSEPISKDGLILDGTLVTPNYQLDGWQYREESINGWWRKYFEGSLQSTEKAGIFHMPFYGRTIGLWLLIKEGRGHVRVVVDGNLLAEASAFRPDWYYGQYVHKDLLDDDWHVLSLIPIGVNEKPAIARIGYLLMQDQSKAPAIPSTFWQKRWPQSRQATEALAKLQWNVIPTASWQVLGPFGGDAAKPYETPLDDLNRDFGVKPQGPVDLKQTLPGRDGRQVTWQEAKGENGWVDLQGMYNLRDRGVAYAHIQIKAAKAGEYDARIAADYFTNVHVNGTLVHTLLQGHGSAQSRNALKLPLKEGVNDLWVTVHAGSMGFGMLMELDAQADLTVMP